MRKVQIMTGFLFLLLVSQGVWNASQRSLWNDEYYTLLSSTLGTSYNSMVIGAVKEGNNSPLFYILQKAQCDLFSYHPPEEWVKGHWRGVYQFDQIFLRIQSIIFVALALSAMFYYFVRRNSLIWGIYALAVTMTSSLFWFHWTEARPYATWFSLSVFQILFLLKILENSDNKNCFNCLSMVNWLLALTTSISIIQIVSASIIIWMYRRQKMLGMFLMTWIPLGTCLFYYFRAPHYDFFFVDGPVSLISANIPKDRLSLILISALILVIQCRFKNWMVYLEMKYFVFFMMILIAFGGVLLKLKLGQTQGQDGFQISSRYFLSLLPAGIMGTVLFSQYLIRAYPARAWKIGAILTLVAFLAFRFYKVI